MFIGLDLGTTNVKTVAVAADGSVQARASAPVELHHVADGGVEQEMEEIWSAALSALRSLGDATNLRGADALGVSAQGGAIQILDGHDRPIGRVISWLDSRGKKRDRGITQRLGHDWLAEHTGHGASAITIGQALRLREARPDVLQPPNRIGYVGDVIVGRLCGRRAHDATSLSLGMVFNPSLGGADPDVLKLIGVEESQLPHLLPVREAAGGLRAEVAERTGLPVGIPVSPAVHDQYAAALGAGAAHPGDVMFGAGTAWVLLAVTEQLARAAPPGAFVCPHPAPGRYGLMMSMANGGSSFAWAVRVMGLEGRSPEQLDALMESAPVGAGGVRFYPFMAESETAGLPRRRQAAWTGLGLGRGQGDLLRAVTEGLALELGRYLRLMHKDRPAPRRLLMCGGAAASRVTPQIVADAAGAPVDAIVETEVSALGAATIARGLTEPDGDLAEIAEEMRPDALLYRPGPNAHDYRRMLDEYIVAVEG